jgi:hypothetical protein
MELLWSRVSTEYALQGIYYMKALLSGIALQGQLNVNQ